MSQRKWRYCIAGALCFARLSDDEVKAAVDYLLQRAGVN
jgi:hypothetical protein